MEIRGAVQNYAWGVCGIKSSVARFAKSSYRNIEIKENIPYAELWMGTHKSGPSYIKANDEELNSFIERHSSCLGSNILNTFGNQLCFLFKVLSVNKSLSIQAHPTKFHAEQLHKNRPEIYKDPNHKPEMAIALTTFHALCGFRPSEEIRKFLSDIPELAKIIGSENVIEFSSDPTEEKLKKCFSALMKASKDEINVSLKHFSERLSTLDNNVAEVLMKSTFLKLYDEYKNDGGCFAIYFLNYILLQPGEAMFLGPNVIHAYLLGDCIECMACSDNVVRAGLTPKYQDVETLLEMLEYKMLPAENRKFKGIKMSDVLTEFNPPIPDFAVQKIEATSGQNVSLTSVKSASIFIVVKGSGCDVGVNPPNEDKIPSPNTLTEGTILFISADQTVNFKVTEYFVAFRALCIE